MVKADRLYAEAEAVYRKYLAEDARIMRGGGVTEPTPALLETTTGEFLANAMDVYRTLHKRKVTVKGKDPTLVLFRREPGRSKAGSVASATTCVDGTGLKFYRNGSFLEPGACARDETYFARVGGVLKIIGADGKQAESCE